MFNLPVFREMSLWEAIIIAVAMVALMGYTMMSLEWIPHLSILLAMIALIIYGMVRGVKYDQLQQGMVASVSSGLGAIYLFSFIGLLVSALMMSGAIPTLMYTGFALISGDYFYLSAFILSSVIGIAIGSSLTTCATVGVAFMAMASVFDANPIVTAGMIVSGAFFGDKMSPLSDTTAIAASTVGIDLFEHIKNMAYTTIPAFLITAIAALYILPSAGTTDLADVQVFREQLLASGLVHNYAVIPFILLIVLAMLKVRAIPTMIITIFSALVVTYLHSSPSLADLGTYFFKGFKLDGFEQVSRLVSRGGVESMFFTQTLVILALSLGGLLFALGIIPSLLTGIKNFLTTAGRATFSVAATSVGVNVLIGEQYLSILLSGETFKPVYEQLGLHQRNLARTLEDAGTVINPLVPWSVCGVFIAQTLNVPVLSYLPFAIFCYASLILTLLFGFTGLTLSRK
ncbi:MAG: Na+/H+ antiporter NhaC [Acinetobacter sp.]|nr:Na+/H+ antiporter NhaC [Acinetobacter sp.]